MDNSSSQPATQDLQETYYQLKSRHAILVSKYEEVCECHQSLNLHVQRLKREYNGIFGSYEIARQDSYLRYRIAERTNKLYSEFADWSLEELLERARELEKAEQKLQELEDLKTDVIMAFGIDPLSDNAPFPPSEENVERQQESIRLINELRRLLHDDKLMHDPNYAALPEEEKKILHDMLIQANKIRRIELGGSLGTVGHALRTPEGLRYNLNKTKAILKQMGIDINTDSKMQGETLVEKIKWLKQEILFLEKDNALLRSQMEALRTEADTYESLIPNMVKDEEQKKWIKANQEERISNFLKKTDAYNQKAHKLEDQLKIRFNDKQRE
jgi:hypothetical protein